VVADYSLLSAQHQDRCPVIDRRNRRPVRGAEDRALFVRFAAMIHGPRQVQNTHSLARSVDPCRAIPVSRSNATFPQRQLPE